MCVALEGKKLLLLAFLGPFRRQVLQEFEIVAFHAFSLGFLMAVVAVRADQVA